jgi:hypothetical protein
LWGPTTDRMIRTRCQHNRGGCNPCIA